MPLLLAAFFLEVGFVLLVVPWSSYWDRNFFSQAWPPLHAVLTSNYVRGAVSGLGVINVLAAVGEIAEVFSGRPSTPPPSVVPPPVPPPPADPVP
jgi:hypothetical protein